jgi:diguanylate cyclase (GGDEF)-like protein
MRMRRRKAQPEGAQQHGCRPGAAALLCVPIMLAVAMPARAELHPAEPLIERGALALRVDAEATREYAQAALALLAEQPDVDLEVRARILLCDYHSERVGADAEREIALAEGLLPRVQRSGLRAGVLVCRGEIEETAGNNDRALALYEEATMIATAAEDDEMLAGALFHRGYLLGLQGEYASGLADLRRAESLFEALEMPYHGMTALNGIASLYNRMGDYEMAREMYVRALQSQREAGMRREQAVTQHNLGRALERLGEWAAAKTAFGAALEISRELDYSRGKAYALRGLAAVDVALGDPGGALATLREAAALQVATPDERLRAQIMLVRGMALKRLGRLDESVAALEDAESVFREGDMLHELAATYAELADLHAASGDWGAAYDRLAEARATAETLLRNQIDQRFATLKVEFDTAAKEEQNELLRRENEANALALAQGRRVRQLQATVLALSAVLLTMLGTLVLYERRSTRRMRELALTDELTDVPNRRAVLARLSEELERPGGASCAILIMDIDHFKAINDRHGHPTGDEVLKTIAAELRATVREPASFGRLGGEEFLIVLPGSSLAEARRAAERFREGMMAIDVSRFTGGPHRITASIGVAASWPGVTPSAMLQRADSALYAAKRSGRNRVQAGTDRAASGSASSVTANSQRAAGA